jgi:hypothetical protein
MRQRIISFELLEPDGWTPHDVPAEIAKEIVRDMVRQMDEPLDWIVISLTEAQLADLLAAARSEMHERVRAHSLNQPAAARVLGEL